MLTCLKAQLFHGVNDGSFRDNVNATMDPTSQ
jgi:hypothetical protein